jgi:uncharacterized membrane protein YdjX (TVP38/TMEM64 family)
MEGVTGSIPVAPTIFLSKISIHFSPTKRQTMTHPRRWLLAVVVLLILAGGLAGIWVFNGTINARSVEAWVAGLGVWAPIGFVLLYGIATIALVPGGIFDLAGGALFGPYFGTLIDLAGATLGAALSFLVARYVAQEWVQMRSGPRLQAVMRSVDADGWQFVAFVRLVPIFPYSVMNYLLGLTRIPFHQYMIATVIFMLPSTIVYTWIGHAGREAVAGDTDGLWYGLLGLALLATMIFLPRLYKRWRGQ